MINNVYTLLADLAKNKDPELVEFLGQYTYTSVKSEYAPLPSNGMANFLTANPIKITKETAKLSIQKILEAIARGETCTEKCADNIMASYLTREGNAKFWQFLRAKGHLSDIDFANEFVSSAKDLQELYKGMPTHEIVVSYNPTEKRSFIIELVDHKTNTRKEITFENNYCYIIYLWFLMYPRQLFTKTEIKNNFENIATIYGKTYGNTKWIKEKLVSAADPTKTGKEDGFEKFFTPNISKVNKGIKAALKGTSADANWYIISLDDKNLPEGVKKMKYYSISLTANYIKLPKVLIKLRDQFKPNVIK